MGKFSAAKILDAMDQKLQKAFNYLIDLLETGYVSESRINDKNIRVEMSPKVGFNISSDGVLIGGITDINGLLASITQIITNDPTDPKCWASVGEYTVDGIVMNGIGIFNRDFSTTQPVLRLMTVGDGSFHLVDANNHVKFYNAPGLTAINDHNGTERINMTLTSTIIKDQNGISRLVITATGDCFIYDSAGYMRVRIEEDGNFATIIAKNGASYNALGVDATGVFKEIAGTKTYL